MQLRIRACLLFIISIYIPSLLYSFHHYSTKIKVLNEIFIDRIVSEDIPQKFKALKLEIKPLIPPEWLLLKKDIPNSYPLGSIPFSEQYYCNEGYGLIKLSHDRFGFRNKDENWNKINKKTNIFILGDDFAHGACVEDNQTITSIVQQKTKINTINLANKSNSSYAYVAMLKSVVKPIIENSLEKNIVIIVWGMSYQGYPFLNKKKEELLSKAIPIVEFSSKGDVYPSKKYKVDLNEFLKNNILQSSDEIMKNLVNEEYKNKFYKNIKNKSFYNISTLVPIRDKFKSYISKSYNKKSIELLSEICKNPCIPIVSYIPESNFWTLNSQPSSYKKSLKANAEKLGLFFVDGEKVINKYNLDDYAPKGPHLSIEGYKKYSNYLSEFIKLSNKN